MLSCETDLIVVFLTNIEHLAILWSLHKLAPTFQRTALSGKRCEREVNNRKNIYPGDA